MVAERKIDQRRLIPGTREVKRCAGTNKAGAPCASTWGGWTESGGRYYCHMHAPGRTPSLPPRHVASDGDNRPIPINLIDPLCRARALSGARCQTPASGGLCAAHRHLAQKGLSAPTAAKAGAMAPKRQTDKGVSDSASQAPLSRFAAIAAGLDRVVAERAANGPKTWTDVVNEGTRAREERMRREMEAQATTKSRKWEPKRDQVEQVIATVADYYGVAVADVKGKRRDWEFTHPRQIIMYLLRRRLNISFSQIGKSLGGRDHTTVIYADTKIERLHAAGDAVMVRELAEIGSELTSLGVTS